MILTIKQCTCAACGNSWVTSSVALRGAAELTEITSIWTLDMQYPRCFRCVTPAEMATLNHLTRVKPSPEPDESILEVPC